MANDSVARGLAIAALSGGGSGGTSDYTDLSNKPQINGVTLSGNKTTSDLGIEVEGAVKYNESQSLTEAQFNQAMSNLQLGAEKNTAPVTCAEDSTERTLTFSNFTTDISISCDMSYGVISYSIEMTLNGTDYEFQITPTQEGGYLRFSGLSSDTDGLIDYFLLSSSLLRVKVNETCTMTHFVAETSTSYTTYVPINANFIRSYVAGKGIAITDYSVSNLGNVGYPFSSSSNLINLAKNTWRFLSSTVTTQTVSAYLALNTADRDVESVEWRFAFITGTLNGAVFSIVPPSNCTVKWADNEPLVLADNKLYEVSCRCLNYNATNSYILTSYNVYDLT